MTKSEYEELREQVLVYYDKARIKLTEAEKESIEVADFGLQDIEKVG